MTFSIIIIPQRKLESFSRTWSKEFQKLLKKTFRNIPGIFLSMYLLNTRLFYSPASPRHMLICVPEVNVTGETFFKSCRFLPKFLPFFLLFTYSHVEMERSKKRTIYLFLDVSQMSMGTHSACTLLCCI